MYVEYLILVPIVASAHCGSPGIAAITPFGKIYCFKVSRKVPVPVSQGPKAYFG